MSIGDAARATGLSPKALRLYDESGLLPPAEVDPVTGYRWYAESQLDRARLVARLRLAGMPLARIRVVADLAGRSRPAAAAALVSWWRQAEADLVATRALVASLVHDLHREEPMTAPTPPTTRPTSLAVDVASYVERGGREHACDAVRTEGGVLAVADGVGDAPGVAADVLAALAGDTLDALDASVTRAAILVAERYADRPGAATTVTAAVVSGDQALLVHVGDSRAHLVRAGRLERLTRDHTVVQTLVDEGRLTPEEARLDDRRVVLHRAVAGDRPAAPDLAVHALQPGDRLVLTTDGVHGVLEPAVLTDLVTTGTPAEVVRAVAGAVRAAGEPDNHACVVADLH
ncbi:MerR family transcriptional regulator [Nocardioides litoris]|uniref:MerR family transcriptional regulator n=1 Tax=Nocardioides litoris TaxID=1926648 RepID=UPI0011241C2C|nr:MerR family transcriptional regulator [Nocardioides litoris]